MAPPASRSKRLIRPDTGVSIHLLTNDVTPVFTATVSAFRTFLRRETLTMKINRIITAEGKSGVIAQVDEALDTETAALTTNIWA